MVCGSLHAVPPPGILNHQGRIVVNGVNPDGVNGAFKFALVDGAGTTTLWSHDGSSAGGGPPVGALSLAITQGHYAVGLGDPGLMQPIPPSVFTNNADVRLRIWFNNELLTPDRRITAAGYALTAGAVADPTFLGTTDNQPLEFKVNNQRGLRLEYAAAGSDQSVNVIGGYYGNSVSANVVGATIAGGGTTNIPNAVTGNFGTVGGGVHNRADDEATVAGGNFNRADGRGSTIGGGFGNNASLTESTVGGGSSNVADGDHATVPGGRLNRATTRAFAAGNQAKANHTGSFVWADSTDANFESSSNNQFLIRASGGVGINKNNPAVALDVNGTVRATAFEGMGAPLLFATTDNQPLEFKVNNQRGLRLEYAIYAGGPDSVNVIGGYSGNSVSAGVAGATVAGGGFDGFTNAVSGDLGTVGGGALNSAGESATVGGGLQNLAGGFAATIPGGEENIASGDYSFAAGRKASANHDGAFVWADSQSSLFGSTANNQFNVRAAGGARLFTGGTGLSLDADNVVFSGSAQENRFGTGAGFDFNTGSGGASSGLLIEQGVDESSGLFFDGDTITLWCPGDDSGNGSRLLRILDEDAMIFGGAAAEKFYVDGSGGFFSAGSGTISGALTVNHPNGTVSVVNDQFTPALVMTGGSAPGVLRVRNALEIWPNTGGTSAGKIDVRDTSGVVRFFADGNTGNVGIGTTNQDFTLTVQGTAGKTGGGSWSSLSDARLKKNVADLHGSLERLLRLRSVSFEYKDPAKGVGPGPQIGFIAQEVREVLPQWVTEGPDGMLAVSVTGFESLTVDALRELRAEKDRQIAELNTENAALKERLDRLERVVAAMQLPATAPMPANAAMEMK